MAKINFTSARIDSFECPEGSSQAFLWDARSPGLGLRVTSSGAKSYIFQAKLHGVTIRLTIGDSRIWSISAAQEEGRRLQTLVNQGVDPREHKAELQAAHTARRSEARRREVTMGEAWDTYVAARRPHWGKLHHHDHVRLAATGGLQRLRSKDLTQAGPLASLRPLRLGDLSSQHLASWLNEEAAKRPTSAALAFRLLRGFIHWTSDIPDYRGQIPVDACSSRLVKDALPKVRAKEGDVLQREQLSAWFNAVRALSNETASTYLQGLLLTGARREELAALTWEDVDFKWRSLTLNDKMEGTSGRVIPLTPYFKQLLVALRASQEQTTDIERRVGRNTSNEIEARPNWVFVSQTAADGRIAEPRGAHVKALSAAGLPHLTLHGLRRSFGTLSEWCETPVGVVAQIQGHKPSAIAEKHYRRRPLDLLRQWHDQIELWILKEADVHPSPELPGGPSD